MDTPRLYFACMATLTIALAHGCVGDETASFAERLSESRGVEPRESAGRELRLQPLTDEERALLISTEPLPPPVDLAAPLPLEVTPDSRGLVVAELASRRLRPIIVRVLGTRVVEEVVEIDVELLNPPEVAGLRRTLFDPSRSECFTDRALRSADSVALVFIPATHDLDLAEAPAPVPISTVLFSTIGPLVRASAHGSDFEIAMQWGDELFSRLSDDARTPIEGGT